MKDTKVLSGECEEITTKEIAIPLDFLFVDWNCYAVRKHDSVQDDYYYDFEDFDFRAYMYDDNNEEYEIGLFPALKHHIEEQLQEIALKEFEKHNFHLKFMKMKNR